MTTFTYRLLASLQVCLLAIEVMGRKGSPMWDRYERAEAYLIRRANRDETPEEAEATKYRPELEE